MSIITHDSVEIAIHGRGGQAALTAGNLLTYALFLEGMVPHGQPRFTPDRMGAPVSYAIRFNQDRSTIHDRSWVASPRIVVLFDLSLVTHLGLAETWLPNILVIANVPEEIVVPEELAGFRVSALDANKIARECGLMKGCVPILSSAMAGAFSKASGLVSLESVQSAMTAAMKGVLSRYMPANLEALRRGFDEVCLRETARPSDDEFRDQGSAARNLRPKLGDSF
jgi:2-oxoacid:acceptor oxidoreductase gamma subunit (pyruvate/2-ketoisovalerate family)